MNKKQYVEPEIQIEEYEIYDAIADTLSNNDEIGGTEGGF